MTLRHKNQGKWAKHVLEHGLSKQDEDTQAATAEQLHLHNLLTRKMNSIKDNSSSDESSDEDDEYMDSSDEEGASKLLAKAKKKTMKLMENDDEVPDSGVLSLPFMVCILSFCFCYCFINLVSPSVLFGLKFTKSKKKRVELLYFAL